MGKKHTFKKVDTKKRILMDEESAVAELDSSIGASSHNGNVPQEGSDSIISPEELEPVSNKQKRVRGPTLMNDIWELDAGIKMEVPVGILGIPIGMEASKLSNFLGSLVRRSSFAPIGYADWRLMEVHYKHIMWGVVEEKIVFCPSCNDNTKQWVMKNLANKWRNWKIEIMSKVFDEKKSPEEMWEDLKDARVEKNQFLTLAGIWLTTKHRKISQQNRQNRLKLEDPHCSGTKTFARIIHEKKVVEGATPSRADIYITTRKRKDGTIVNEKAKELMELMEKHQEVEKTGISNDASSWQGDAYALVKGVERKGIIRCLGPIVPSSMSSTTSSSQEQIQATLNSVLDLLTGVVQMCKEQHPNANIESLMQTARDLSSQVKAAPGKTQGSKGASTLNDAHTNKGPSSSNNP